MLSLVFFVMLTSLAGPDVPKKPEKIAPPACQTSPRELPSFVVACGQVQPAVQVKISPEVSGEIIELPVSEGQRVHKGDLLMKIKPDFYIAGRDQADGSYKSAIGNLEIAQARLEQAQAELKRNQKLYHNHLLSDSAFLDAKTACEVAMAQLTNADGQVEMARASLAMAQSDLDKTTILSPIDGTVATLNSQIGERVVGTATMAGTEVMTIADLDRMQARVDVHEKDIGSIVFGQSAQLEAYAFPDKVFAGTVVGIATSGRTVGTAGGAAGGETSEFEVRIRLKQVGALRPGMFVTAKIRIPTPPSGRSG